MNSKVTKSVVALVTAMLIFVSAFVGTTWANFGKDVPTAEVGTEVQQPQQTEKEPQPIVVEKAEDDVVTDTIKPADKVIPVIKTENTVIKDNGSNGAGSQSNKDNSQSSAESNKDNSQSGNGNNGNTQTPVVPDTAVTESIECIVNSDSTLAQAVTMTSEEGITATVPAGVKVNAGAKQLTLTITSKDESDSDVNLEETEKLDAYDVHIEGVAKDNTTPIAIDLGEVLNPGLNKGNLAIYHVENGETVKMSEVDSAADFTAHNQFAYNPENGAVAVAMTGFSEVAVVSEEAKWEGNFDYSWYNTTDKNFTIANADQLAAFGAIVGGMNGQTQDSFAGKTVKLISDINLGDDEEHNDTDKIFYPIGYYNDEGTYEKTNVAITSSVSSFSGTFDGNGHTISNFYQNTWEMKGDDGYYDKTLQYYNDAMGLFGYVLNGTVKNLTVENFKSDGEYTPTGVIAAYADGNSTFENIAITNCNPRVYNTGNGGIIGVAGDTNAANDDHITLKNITVDNSNKISALWGSWDVACGGIVGMYRGNVDGSGNATGDTISFENCHVSAQIDVYNDVCANYQYYAYRYAGMIIGSVRHNTKNAEGKTIPNMAGISATGCTVNFGTWNNYYYCELVANTLASYTHDHQFSRLTEIKAIDGTTITYLDGTTGTVPSSGRYNYVVVNGVHSTENATCYHFVDGEVWNHEDAGKETVNGSEVLKENNQHIYLPIHQLFTGYSWGVSNIGLKEYSGIATDLGITEGDQEESVEKFEKADTAKDKYTTETPVTIGELFTAVENAGVDIDTDNVQVTVSPADENSTVSAVYTPNTTEWTQGTLTFSGTGAATITITDYYFCKPTTIGIDICVVKFEIKEVPKEPITAKEEILLKDLFNAVVDEGNNEENIESIGRVNVKIYEIKDSIARNAASNRVLIWEGSFDDWKEVEISLPNAGSYVVEMDDDFFCAPVEVQLEIKAEKFESKFNKDFLYRVGNQNAVELGSLFEIAPLKDQDGNPVKEEGIIKRYAIDPSDIEVSIEKIDEKMDVDGTFNINTSEWKKGTIQFSGTGIVKVTIKEKDSEHCIPTELLLEVVDATNLTSAMGTTEGKGKAFVLLCDVNTSTYVNYWDCTLYGNGFTYSLKGAPTAYNSKQGHGILITKNATFDNLVIVGDVYNSYGAYTNQDYYNAAVDVIGNTTIKNCYISGCSAPVLARADVTIIDTTLYGGTVANLIIKSGKATLENVTTANYDDGRELVGMGIVVHSDATESAKLVLNGTLTQYNFISESKVPTDTYAKNLHSAMFGSGCSQYHFGTSPNRYVNAGIISLTALFNREDITDNDNTGYVGQSVTENGINGYVYTQPNTSGTVNNNCPEYKPTTQGAVPPSYSFDFTNKNYIAKTNGSNDYCYEENGKVNISMDDGDTFNWDTSILTIGKGIKNYTVSMNGTDYTGKSIAFNTAGDYTVKYTYTDTNNYKLDENGNITTYSVTYTKTVNITVAVVEATTKHAEFTFGSSNIASTTVTVGNNTYVMPNVSGTSSTIGSTTVNGQTIYYPIVEIIMSDGKTSHSSAWYAYFPVFSGAVTITDYKDNGLGEGETFGSSTQSMPEGLSVVGEPTQLFKYQSSSAAGTSPVVKNNKLVYSSPSISAKRSEYNTVIQYSYQDKAGATYYYYIGYHAPAQSYSSVCVTPDTLVTLYDGTTKRIDEVTYEDQLLVWDFYTGQKISAPSSIVMNHGEGEYEIVTVEFSDGTKVNTINGHGFYDADEKQFVILSDSNVADYIGHKFVKADGTKVELVDYSIKTEYTESWSILTAVHYNCVMEGMWTLTPAEVENSPAYLMPFEIGEDMKFVEDKMYADIQEYGMYTYEEFQQYMTMEQFYAFNFPIFKVSVGKGYFTYEDILYLISVHFNVEIQDVTVPYVQAMATSIMALANIDVEPISTYISEDPEPTPSAQPTQPAEELSETEELSDEISDQPADNGADLGGETEEPVEELVEGAEN